VHTIESAGLIRIKSGKERVEVLLRRAVLGDQLEGLAHRLTGTETLDQHVRNLAPSHDAIAEIAHLASIALQEHQSVLIGWVIVEPPGAHDGVRKAARAHQLFATALPVMHLGWRLYELARLMTSPRRISTLGSPSHCVQPSPAVTINV